MWVYRKVVLLWLFLWFCSWENLFVAHLSFRSFCDHKQFCSRFVAFYGICSRFETTPEWCFVKKQSSINLGFLQKFFKENDRLVGSFCWRFYQLFVVFVMLTKCCIFAIKTESWLLSKLFISSVSDEYRNFLREV